VVGCCEIKQLWYSSTAKICTKSWVAISLCKNTLFCGVGETEDCGRRESRLRNPREHYAPSSCPRAVFYFIPLFSLLFLSRPLLSFPDIDRTSHPSVPRVPAPHLPLHNETHTPSSLISSNKLPPEDFPRPIPIWPSAVHCNFVHLKEHRILSYRTAASVTVLHLQECNSLKMNSYAKNE
jgi:hypothetical protein